MKNAVLMDRPLFGSHIAQNSKTEMFSATDLCRVGNKWRMANDIQPFVMNQWLKNKNTTDFVKSLEDKFGKGNIKKSARGRGKHTWIHPLLFIDMALAISPELKIETYQWLFDHLILFRNQGGDSYNAMCGALYNRCSRKTDFPFYIRGVAIKIRLACNVDDWNTATQEQLDKRKKLHNDIHLLADVLNNNDEAVRLAILKAR